MPVKVLVCGGGNGAHALTGLGASRPNVEVHTLTIFADEAERWNKAMGDGPVYVTYKANGQVIEGRPTLVTKDAQKACEGVGMIILCVPSFGHAGYLTAIAPYVNAGAVIVALPGNGGFEFDVKGILGDAKSRSVTVINLNTLPWACRFQEFGKRVDILGTKDLLMGSITHGTTAPPFDAVQQLQIILGDLPKLAISGHVLGITLNNYIHPTIMYGRWKDWDGAGVDHAPLFYQGIDRATAALLEHIDAELMQIKAKVLQIDPKIDLDVLMPTYQWYLQSYPDDIVDKTDLYTCMTTNKAYNGLTHPCKQQDGKFFPDFGNRYITEDIPFGMVVVRGIAEVLHIPTPYTDMVIQWCEKKMGKTYLVDGKLTGPDVGSSRCPQRYHLTTIEQIL